MSVQCMIVRRYSNLGNFLLLCTCSYILYCLSNFLCNDKKVDNVIFFKWYDDETCARGREVLPGLYKQVRFLKDEVSSLKVRLKIQTYILVFSLVLCLELICHQLIRHRGIKLLCLGH